VEKFILTPLIEEPDRVDVTKIVLALRVLPIMVENPMKPPNKVEAVAVEVRSVLPCAVEKAMFPTLRLEPVKKGMFSVLPWRVEKVRMPPLIVEPSRVEITRVLPCAVEKLSVLTFNVDVLTVETWMVLPCAVEKFTLTLWTVEMVVVEKMVRLLVVTVLPTILENPRNPLKMVETFIVDAINVLPSAVEKTRLFAYKVEPEREDMTTVLP
jgi:hypothetical protein